MILNPLLLFLLYAVTYVTGAENNDNGEVQFARCNQLQDSDIKCASYVLDSKGKPRVCRLKRTGPRQRDVCTEAYCCDKDASPSAGAENNDDGEVQFARCNQLQDSDIKCASYVLDSKGKPRVCRLKRTAPRQRDVCTEAYCCDKDAPPTPGRAIDCFMADKCGSGKRVLLSPGGTVTRCSTDGKAGGLPECTEKLCCQEGYQYPLTISCRHGALCNKYIPDTETDATGDKTRFCRLRRTAPRQRDLCNAQTCCEGPQKLPAKLPFGYQEEMTLCDRAVVCTNYQTDNGLPIPCHAIPLEPNQPICTASHCCKDSDKNSKATGFVPCRQLIKCPNGYKRDSKGNSEARCKPRPGSTDECSVGVCCKTSFD